MAEKESMKKIVALKRSEHSYVLENAERQAKRAESLYLGRYCTLECGKAKAECNGCLIFSRKEALMTVGEEKS